MQFNFKIGHIAGSVNKATKFLSRLELKTMENIRLKIRKDVQTTPIEVTIYSLDVADEEKIFFKQTFGENETEEPTPEHTEQPRKRATEWASIEEPTSIKPSIKDFTKIDWNTTSYSINGNKPNSWMQAEPDVDLFPENLKLETLGQPDGEVLLTTDRRHKHYKEMKIVSFSKMDCYSRNSMEKLIASNTTKFSNPSNLLTNYSGTWRENAVDIPES